MAATDPVHVLAAPRRRRIFEVVEAAGPIGVAELAAEVGVHENTVRLHLTALADAGLVVQEAGPAAGGPGRRAYRYRATGADPVREADAYHRLAEWLAEAVRMRSGARAAGRRLGARAAGSAQDGRDELASLFEREGFAPEWSPGGSELVLRRCPFAAAAHADPGIICALHLGLAEGVADATGDVVVERLERVGEPARGGCRLFVRPQQALPGRGGR